MFLVEPPEVELCQEMLFPRQPASLRYPRLVRKTRSVRLSIMLAGAGEAGSQARLRSSEKINKILKMSDSDEEELDKEAVGKKIAEELPAEILQEYKDIFSYFDRDGGGSIGAEEFDQVMRTFGWEPKDEELKEMVSVIDQDGDGTISFNEFVWLMTR